MPSPDNFPRVLCIACSPTVFAGLDHAFRYSGLHVLSAATRENGVAVCISEVVAIAVLDGASIRGEELSVVQSLKMVQPNLPIIFLEERERLTNIPDGIDAVVPFGATDKLLLKIGELLNSEKKESSAAG